MQNPKNDKAMVCNMVITFSKVEHSTAYNRKKVMPNYKVTLLDITTLKPKLTSVETIL